LFREVSEAIGISLRDSIEDATLLILPTGKEINFTESKKKNIS
jgi:hypothetical protein